MEGGDLQTMGVEEKNDENVLVIRDEDLAGVFEEKFKKYWKRGVLTEKCSFDTIDWWYRHIYPDSIGGKPAPWPARLGRSIPAAIAFFFRPSPIFSFILLSHFYDYLVLLTFKWVDSVY